MEIFKGLLAVSTQAGPWNSRPQDTCAVELVSLSIDRSATSMSPASEKPMPATGFDQLLKASISGMLISSTPRPTGNPLPSRATDQISFLPVRFGRAMSSFQRL